MKRLPLIALAFAIAAAALAGYSQRPSSLDEMALQALGSDRAARTARSVLRSAGDDGLEAMLAVHLEALAAREPSAELRDALDEVCAQRDCAWSRLYWHTDLDDALQRARELDRPVLSLSMLGRLDEEMSCANSRFFRTLLYPDPQVRILLSRRYVLHWQSVRPAPIVRIDMGDGRILERTVTGNSAHFVVDSAGLVVDAMPGLVGPLRFATWLESAAELEHELRGLQGDQRAEQMRRFHEAADRGAGQELERRLTAIGQAHLKAEIEAMLAVPTRRAVDARSAALRAQTKSVSELPTLDAVFGGPGLDAIEVIETQRILASLADPEECCSISEEAMTLINLKLGDQSRWAVLPNLQRSLAADTVRNELGLQRVIRRWLAQQSWGLNRLRRQVYSELFATPDDDPWLGLRPEWGFSAIENDGLRSLSDG